LPSLGFAELRLGRHVGAEAALAVRKVKMSSLPAAELDGSVEADVEQA